MILGLPSVGMRRSVQQHNVTLPILCDWLEGDILFTDDTISKSDVVDILLENEIYDEQQFAYEIVDNAWIELRRRQLWVGSSSPIAVVEKRLARLRSWSDAPAHSFCIALAYAAWYPNWSKQFGSDFTEQGELFELLTQEALQVLFPQWEVYRTGWTRSHTSKLVEIVRNVASLLGEEEGQVDRWAGNKAHEAGLDLLCYRPFYDGRVGVPTFLVQCASGRDWEDKLHTPSLEVWRKIVLFASEPKKAFVMPFALDDGDFTRKCNLVNGLFLDRYRLLSAGRTAPDWVSEELKKRTIRWLDERVASLPTAYG